MHTRVGIDAGRSVRHLGPDSGVYATPAFVNDIETLCRDLLLAHADEGEDSVGTHIDVRHLAPTPEGLWVEITASVADVIGRSVTFDITARDAVEEIGAGRHTRVVVAPAKIRQRIAAKAASAGVD
jgi:fluoroacetyl-CoA thioesterase